MAAFYARHRPDVIDSKVFYIHCFPHVINIVCQKTIKALQALAAEDDSNVDDNDHDIGDDIGDDSGDDGGNDSSDDSSSDDDDDGNGSNPTKVPKTLLKKIRALVRTIRASGQRQDELVTLIVQGNSGNWWTGPDGPIQLNPLKLLLDVRTRWDSTFMMLTRLHEFKLVRELFLPKSELISNWYISL